MTFVMSILISPRCWWRGISMTLIGVRLSVTNTRTWVFLTLLSLTMMVLVNGRFLSRKILLPLIISVMFPLMRVMRQPMFVPLLTLLELLRRTGLNGVGLIWLTVRLILFLLIMHLVVEAVAVKCFRTWLISVFTLTRRMV